MTLLLDFSLNESDLLLLPVPPGRHDPWTQGAIPQRMSDPTETQVRTAPENTSRSQAGKGTAVPCVKEIVTVQGLGLWFHSAQVWLLLFCATMVTTSHQIPVYNPDCKPALSVQESIAAITNRPVWMSHVLPVILHTIDLPLIRVSLELPLCVVVRYRFPKAVSCGSLRLQRMVLPSAPASVSLQ